MAVMTRTILLGLILIAFGLLIALICLVLLITSRRRFARQRERLLEEIERGFDVS